jgi:hypothetical protein
MGKVIGTIIEIPDTSEKTIDATFLSRADLGKDPNQQLANMGNHFRKANAGVLKDFGVDCDLTFAEKRVALRFRTRSTVGAFPMISPSTGKPEIGLIVRPRFGWAGVGSVLGITGWKVVPELLMLPLLPKSERKIPPWVLSLTLLPRIEKLLQHLQRKFDFQEQETNAPKGQVNWTNYAVKKFGTFKMLEVPCRFPSLQYNQELKAAIHYTLLVHLRSLQNQTNNGSVIFRLLEYCQNLIENVAGCPPKKPSPKFFDRWQKVPIKSDILREGLQAIQWTADERGLAGLGELEGIPWMMRMEQFFEGWLESLVKRAAMLTGGIVKSGRLKQTVAALSWDPAFVGSQRSLIPDLVVEREDQVIIFDAKYKQHWEEIREKPWWKIEEDIKEQHRIDLFQILAYSTLFSRQNIIACLVYPCSLKTWESLKTRGRLSHRAFLGFENRRISLLFTAVPMAGNMTDIVDELIRLLKNAL